MIAKIEQLLKEDIVYVILSPTLVKKTCGA